VILLLIGHEGEYEVALIRLGGGFGVVIGWGFVLEDLQILGGKYVHVAAHVLLLEGAHEETPKLLELEDEARLWGDLHDRFGGEGARPLDQAQLLLQLDVNLAVDAQLDFVVAAGGWMGKGLFDVHIICSQTDGLVSYYNVAYLSKG
jgi:hypothetical protein